MKSLSSCLARGLILVALLLLIHICLWFAADGMTCFWLIVRGYHCY